MRRTVLSDISAILVDVLEFSQRLDDVDVLSRPGDHQLRAFVQGIIEDFQGFQDVAPVLAFIIQSLVEHVHDLEKVGGAVS